MSFSESLNASSDKIIMSFIEKVSANFSINKEELLGLWRGGAPSSFSMEIPKELSSLSKPELIEMCKSKSLKHGGSKMDLIQRIIAFDKPSAVANVPQPQKPQPQPTPLPKLVTRAPTVALHRNAFGNYEHEETRFVFNEKIQKVIGKQNPDGTVLPLTVEDINICKKFKFDYQIPLNLQDQDEKVELVELEEDEVEVEVIEEEDEEEQEEEEVELELDDDE